MKDYTKTSDRLYAYRWPRASVTADAEACAVIAQQIL